MGNLLFFVHNPPVRQKQPPPHRAGAVLRALPEAVVLTLLTALPAFTNTASARIFEEEKALLLRAGAVIALGATAVGWLGWRHVASLRPWRHPISLALLALTAALTLAAVAGIAPRDALMGAYVRQHGVLLWLGLLVLFGVMAGSAQDAAGRDRLIVAAVLGSVWPSLYALIQVAGLDPVDWTGTFAGRAASTAGNPILLGGYLVVVIPLTAALAWRTRRAAWAACLVLQLGALAAAGSRGPMLALLTAAAMFVIASMWTRERATRLAAALIVAAAAAAIIAFVPAARPAPIDRLLDAQGGSGRVRVLIWEGVTQLMRGGGARLWIGYGPESLRRLFPPYYSPEIGVIEGTEAMPDRAPNEMLDMLVSGGVVGVALELAFFVLVLVGAFRVRDRRLRAGLAAAAVAHIVEVQLGIATVSSRLMFVTVAALVTGIRDEPAGAASTPWRALTLAAAAGAASLALAPLVRGGGDTTSGSEADLLAYLVRLSSTSAVAYLLVFAAAVVVARAIAQPERSSRAAPVLAVAITAAAVVAGIVPLSLSPSRADVFARAASGFESRQQWREARVAWREALRLQPKQDTYLVGLARVLMQESAFTDARAALRRAAELNPQDPYHPRSLASVERLRTRTIPEAERAAALAEADRQYARATALAPGLPALWIEWANVDAERRDFQAALGKLARAITLDATRIDAWRLRGLIDTLQRRPNDALADYDRALAIAPADVVALRGRAFALAELGRRNEALSAVSEVLAVAPADNAALRLRARLEAESPR